MLLLLSDIHANAPALEAVLEDAQRHACSRTVFLGDAVGYGPHPAEVLKLLRGAHAEGVLGNHEQMLLALQGGAEFEDTPATAALRWQLGTLRPLELARLARWPRGREDTLGGRRACFCHGSPRSLNEYVLGSEHAGTVLEAFGDGVVFHGHTHLAGVYALAPGLGAAHGQQLSRGGRFRVPPRARALLNPGSVGQPRDGNPRASYATYDPAGFEFTVYRVAYDIDRVVRDIRAAGLPPRLGERLREGR